MWQIWVNLGKIQRALPKKSQKGPKCDPEGQNSDLKFDPTHIQGYSLKLNPLFRVYPKNWGWVNFLNFPKLTTSIFKGVTLQLGEYSTVLAQLKTQIQAMCSFFLLPLKVLCLYLFMSVSWIHWQRKHSKRRVKLSNCRKRSVGSCLN